MAKKGIYSRHECNSVSGYDVVDKPFPDVIVTLYNSTNRNVYTEGYTCNKDTGMINTVGASSRLGTLPIGTTFYGNDSTGAATYLDKHQLISRGGGDHKCYRVSLRSEWITVYSRGTYLNDVIVDYGTLPANDRHTDGYWYVFIKMASDFKVNVGGIWRDAPTGYANVGGINRPQSEVKVNVNGIYK